MPAPNREYNANFELLGLMGLRHGDHRFGWTLAGFLQRARRIEDRSGYEFEITGIGPDDPLRRPPTRRAGFGR